jgi:hypothetical protein
MGRGREGRREKEGRRPLQIPRRRWVDNIELNLGIGWIDLTEDGRNL